MARQDVVIRFGADTADLDRQLSGVERSVGNLRSVFVKLGGTFALGALSKQLFDAATAVDRFSRSFAQIAGSNQRAQAELEYVGRTAERLGISIDSARAAYLSLTAAANGTALEGQQSRRIFEAVAGAMAKLGKSADDTRGALLAIEQIISKGVVSAEELRGQLGERLPGAFQAAARAMGVTTQELGKLLQTGQITAEQMLPALARELERVYGTQGRVETLAASWERFKNSVSELAETVGGALNPVFEGTLEIATKVVRKIETLANGIRLLAADAQIAWERMFGSSDRVRELGYQRELIRQDMLGYQRTPGGGLNIDVSGSGRAVPGATGGATRGTGGFNPEFGSGLNAFLQAAEKAGVKIAVTSGVRTLERQTQLWESALKKYGSAAEANRWVARPTPNAPHVRGVAADLSYGPGAREWAAANAGRFGLQFPMGNEPWHIQLIEQGAKAATASRGLTQAQQAQNQVMEEGRRIWEATRTVAEAHVLQVDRLAELYKAGAFGEGAQAMDTYRRAVEQSAEGLTQLRTVAEETDGVARDLGLTFASAFEDAIVQARSLREVVQGLAQDVLRIFVRKTVTERAGGFLAGVFGGLFGGARAAGGPVTGGRPYLVGERGPELFVPSASGSIVPNGATMAPRVTINNAPGMDARTRDDGQGGIMIDIIRRVLADDVARGGVGWTRGLESAYGLGRGR